jgi:Skp family chaperone for outer membrane proteins
MTKYAYLLVATAAIAPLPAAAQVAGIATTSPEIVIARAAARNTGYQQIGTQYAAQITQIGTLRNEVQTLLKSMDTNNDNQLSDAERNAKPAVVTQIQQKEQQINTVARPITIAQAYVLDQLAREYHPVGTARGRRHQRHRQRAQHAQADRDDRGSSRLAAEPADPATPAEHPAGPARRRAAAGRAAARGTAACRTAACRAAAGNAAPAADGSVIR